MIDRFNLLATFLLLPLCLLWKFIVWVERGSCAKGRKKWNGRWGEQMEQIRTNNVIFLCCGRKLWHGSLKGSVKSYLQKNRKKERIQKSYRGDFGIYISLRMAAAICVAGADVCGSLGNWLQAVSTLLLPPLPCLRLEFLQTILPHSVQSIMPRFCCIRIFLTLKKSVKEIQIKIMAAPRKNLPGKAWENVAFLEGAFDVLCM